jgi:antitoxin component YwqK of YwqJK toxin-antitoxin module
MMKKTLAAAAIILAFLASCKQKPREVVEENYPSGSPKVVRVYADKQKKVWLKETHLYEDSTRMMEGGFADTLRNGPWTAWFRSGQVWSQGYYKKGLQDSLWTVYYPNGQVYYTGMFKEGKRVGEWKFYDQTGLLAKTVDYSNPHQ